MKKRSLIFITILTSITIGFVIYFIAVIKINLVNQKGTIIFPPQLDVMARATNEINIGLHGKINAKVPFRQTVRVPLKGRYNAQIALKADIPLELMLHYKGNVPIKTKVDINAKTDLVFENRLLSNFPLSFTLPLEFEQPVDLKIPVKTIIKLDYLGPVGLVFLQHANVPINDVLNTYLNVDRNVSTPISSSFCLKLQAPSDAQELIIHNADLRIPLTQLKLSKNSKKKD